MKKCFFISPIGGDKSLIRKRSDKLLTIIQSVVRLYGYELIRGDSYGKPGNITTQIISLLIESELSIVDLSEENANVFYELGIRHSTGKIVIPIIEKGKEIPFDLGQERTIFYELGDETKIEDFKINLNRVVANSIKFPTESHNPVSRLDDFISLKSVPITNEHRLIRVINKITKLYRLLGPMDNPSSLELGKQSTQMLMNIAPKILEELDGQLSKLLNGTVETWGDMNNEIFELLVGAVNDYFRAISVNDLRYWATPEGNQYLEYLTSRIRAFDIKAERIFVVESFESFLSGTPGSEKKYFESILLNQVALGVHVRIAYMDNVKLIHNVITDLDFGLFDDFAVSFFRLTEGRTHKVDFTKEQYRKHSELFDKVKFKCEINPNASKSDERVFTNEKDLKSWYDMNIEKIK